jgi:glycosyltransferase involved in cell wall biosynthesis
MRLLAVTYGLPWPLTEGAKIRDYHLLRETAKDLEIILLSLCKDDRNHPGFSELRRFCVHVESYVPPERPSWGAAAAHWRARRPWATFPFYFEPFAQRVAALCERYRADIVQIEHSFLAAYRNSIPRSCRAILSLHNVGERQYRGMVGLAGGGVRARLKAAVMQGWEGDWARRFDHCITVSGEEEAWLRRRAPRLPITVIENGVDCARLRPLPPAAGNELLFVGVLGYPPNADAVIHFARHCLPLLRRLVPGIKLLVVGRNPRRDVRALTADDGIELHEDVPDIMPFYQRARACIVPLRAGGGTRIKILEAMALGRPVVSTSKGCEGLGLIHGNQLLIADRPADLASEIKRLLVSPSLGARLCAQARCWVEEHHDWVKIGDRLRTLYRGLLERTAEATR